MKNVKNVLNDTRDKVKVDKHPLLSYTYIINNKQKEGNNE